MPAAWSSDHPDVLAWWEDVQKRNKAYTRECRKVEKETGRTIVMRTGFGDEMPMGLKSHSYREDPPPGWKIGWGKRDHGFFEPRHTPSKGHPKEACEAAKVIIGRLIAKHVQVRQEAEDRFGVPDCYFFGLHAISPGFYDLNGRLWVTFGEHDYEPKDDSPMLKFFKPEKFSAYVKAREDAGKPVERGEDF